MWDSLGPWVMATLGSGGLVGLGRLVYRMHLDAIMAHKLRADDWRTACERLSATCVLKDELIARLMGRQAQ